MTITNEQIKIFLISAVIGSIIYMLIYSKKGQDKSIGGYFYALTNCFTLTVVSIFIVVGIWLIKVCLTQPLYVGLIIPLGWFFIAYNIIKNILNNAFGTNIHILNPEWNLIKFIKENSIIIPNVILLIGFAFATYMILFKALPDTANQPYGPIPVLLVGIIFLGVTIGLGFLLYSTITRKLKFTPTNELTADRKRVYKVEKNFKNKKLNKHSSGPPNILLLFIIMMGVLFLSVGVIQNNKYNEQSKDYIEVQGFLVGTKIYSKDRESGNTYSLIYSYEVNGEIYNVATDYGTAAVPKQGTEKTILYNPDNPSEAVIKGNSSSMLLFIIAALFIGIPVLIIGGKILNNTKNDTIKEIFETIWVLLIGALFIGFSIVLYYFMCAGGNEVSIGAAIQAAGFTIIFPFIFAVAGIMIIISSIYLKIKDWKENHKSKKV